MQECLAFLAFFVPVGKVGPPARARQHMPSVQKDVSGVQDEPLAIKPTPQSRKMFKKIMKGRHGTALSTMCQACSTDANNAPVFIRRMLGVFEDSEPSFPGRMTCLTLCVEVSLMLQMWTSREFTTAIQGALDAMRERTSEIRRRQKCGTFAVSKAEHVFLCMIEAIVHVRSRLGQPDSLYWRCMGRARVAATRLERAEPERVGLCLPPGQKNGAKAAWVVARTTDLTRHALQRIALHEKLDYDQVGSKTGSDGKNYILDHIDAVRRDKCYACGRRQSSRGLFTCARCGVAKYCDGECARWHWHHAHKAECQPPGVFKVGNYFRFPGEEEDDKPGILSSGEIVRAANEAECEEKGLTRLGNSWLVVWVDAKRDGDAAVERKIMCLDLAKRDAYCLAMEHCGGLLNTSG